MQRCVVCDEQRRTNNVLDAVRQWLWEDAPYLLPQFPAMKYTAKHYEDGSTMLCRACLVDHVREWLADIDAPRGVRQRYNEYFNTGLRQTRPHYMRRETQRDSEDTVRRPEPKTKSL